MGRIAALSLSSSMVCQVSGKAHPAGHPGTAPGICDLGLCPQQPGNVGAPGPALVDLMISHLAFAKSCAEYGMAHNDSLSLTEIGEADQSGYKALGEDRGVEQGSYAGVTTA